MHHHALPRPEVPGSPWCVLDFLWAFGGFEERTWSTPRFAFVSPLWMQWVRNRFGDINVMCGCFLIPVEDMPVGCYRFA